MHSNETRSTQGQNKHPTTARTSLGTQKSGSSAPKNGSFEMQSKHLEPLDTPPGTIVIGDLVFTLPLTGAQYAALEGALGEGWKIAARKAASDGGAEVLELFAEQLPADLMQTPAAQDLADGYAKWVMAETKAEGTNTRAELGVKSDEKASKDGEGEGNQIFSQAQWYSAGGRPLNADEVRNVVAVLNTHKINEGASDHGDYLFGADGKPKGLLEWAGTKSQPYRLKPGEVTVAYTGCPTIGGREDKWNYWFTNGKKSPFVTSSGMLDAGVPSFSAKGDASTQIASDLMGLDLAFIPGPQSCVRTVYAMEVAYDPKSATIGSKSRVAFNPATDRELLLDGPLAAGHHLCVRTRGGGHSILVVAHLGGDEYLVDDPGRNTLGNIGRPRGQHTYVDGVLVPNDKGKNCKIEEIQVVP